MVIPVPGQLVGVVGPNGCGKSNVIDAVRWVLGESRAQHLRGDKMEDVIFSGSASRKPVSRASVELHFDNSLGRAAGQWSQYAEISVKRVLTRQGDSSYFINGSHVRRRDIQDIFLGTGLGPRAYAIIEQGMISRIIEAKPEELRVFLEEAAGVSKYKERRRETESRLADARDNLARVDDIVAELAQQVDKLAAQAVIAEQYRQLQAELALAQNLLAYSRKRAAAGARERHARDMDRLALQLEEATAKLREIETAIDAARQQHYAAGDRVNAAQGELYAANAEVARLEQELEYLRANRRRIESQQAGLARQHAEAAAGRELSLADIELLQRQLGAAADAVHATQAALANAQAALPQAETAVLEARNRLAAAQRAVAQAEQAQSVEEARENHALRILSRLEGSKTRLQQERMSLPAPSDEELARMQADLDAAATRLTAVEAQAGAAEGALPGLEARRDDLLRQDQEARSELTRAEAQLAALTTQQLRLDNNQKLAAWLARHGLAGHARLWQQVAIEPGWEDALESVLGARLNALRLDDLQQTRGYLADPPPGTVAFFAADGVAGESGSVAGLCPLMALVQLRDATIGEFVRCALAGTYAIDDDADGLSIAQSLPAGAVAVTRRGHLFGHGGVLLYGPHSELHGVLQRQREIDALKQQLPERQNRCGMLRDQATAAQAQLQQRRDEAKRSGAELVAARERAHLLQLQQVRMLQNAELASLRLAKIRDELAQIRQEEEKENLDLRAAQQAMQQGAAAIESLIEVEETIRGELRSFDATLDTARAAALEADRAAQQAVFEQRSCGERITSANELVQRMDARIAEIQAQQRSLVEELDKIVEAPLLDTLQSALAARTAREAALAAARDALEGLTVRLREADEARLTAESALEPLREKITDARLKSQEARLIEDQYATQLAEANADLEQLAALIEKRRSTALQQEISRLSEALNALGAVNLAALQELEAARQRMGFLESQGRDLREAVDTLEAAIRRIDRETRELLQSTYDAVNRNFSEMFPALFGGGNARLELTGEELLDAGLIVMAQPPGKKNSSIHLLSGGEKALAALALVFSMFRLNPAPFCLLDEVDAPLDDPNTERFCELVRKMASDTQFLFISHNKLTMEMAQQLVGITMQEQGVSRVVAVDIEEALKMKEAVAA